LPMKDQLSKDSQRRLEENPLRGVGSKEKEENQDLRRPHYGR